MQTLHTTCKMFLFLLDTPKNASRCPTCAMPAAARDESCKKKLDFTPPPPPPPPTPPPPLNSFPRFSVLLMRGGGSDCLCATYACIYKLNIAIQITTRFNYCPPCNMKHVRLNIASPCLLMETRCPPACHLSHPQSHAFQRLYPCPPVIQHHPPALTGAFFRTRFAVVDTIWRGCGGHSHSHCMINKLI